MNDAAPDITSAPPLADDEASARAAFGQMLRAIRQAKGVGQSLLATRADLCASYLCGIELAQRPAPATEVIQRLATALSLSEEAERALLAAGAQARRAWDTHTRHVRRMRSVRTKLRQDEPYGTFTQALAALREGWCGCLEIEVPDGRGPLRMKLWSPGGAQKEVAM